MPDSQRRLRRAAAALGSAVLFVGLLGLSAGPPAQALNPAAVPLAVPPATGNNAVIAVKVGADRVGTTAVSSLAGVRLQLYDGTASGPTTAVTDDWATCTSDADGDCNFVVPNTQPGAFGCFGTAGANCDRRFWVVQLGVPSGFNANPFFRTGSGDGTGSEATSYWFRTGTTLRAGNTYSSQTNFMVGTGSTNRTASGGIWQQSRENPAPVQQCGLDVALVLDLSGSVTAAQLVQLKAASDTFTDSLVGTPSQMALFSFSTVTPAVGATQNYPGLVSVSTQEGADAFKARYAGWTASGGTNWDRGLAAPAEAEATYDVVVVVTDGNPTFYSQPAEGPGNFTRIREMENGVFSANAVKAQLTRVLAVGVGTGVSDTATAQNLRAISGLTAYDGSNALTADYYQVSDYSVVGEALRELALGECAGSLSVVKQIVPSGGDIDDATPGGAGWTFDASTDSEGVELETSSATTDSSSAVNFPISYVGGATAGTIEIQELPNTGAGIFPVDGANAVCSNLDTGDSLTVTNAAPAGFTVDVPSTAAVSCLVYNQIADPASLVVDKEWVINGADPVPEGNQPAGFTSQLTLTGPGTSGATNQDWQVARVGYLEAEEVTIGEQVTLQAPDIDADLCEVSQPAIVAVNGDTVSPIPVPDAGYEVTLQQGANSYTIRNTVECEARLTLAKEVEGEANPAAWTLTAHPAPDEPAGQLPGPTGQAGSAAVTDQTVTPGVPYQLAESDGPPTYLQVDERTSQQVYPLSTGSWSCIRVDTEGNQISGFSDGLNGGVTVPVAERVQCTATNQTARLTLAKEVINSSGGTAVPADFTLSAVPSETPPVTGLEPVIVAGASPDTAIAQEIRPEHPYTLSETGPAGFTRTELNCFIDGTQQAVTEITLARGEAVVCVFVNVDDPALLTLRKTVDVGATRATQTAVDWTLTATPQEIEGQGPVSGNGADGVTDEEVAAGSYALTESVIEGFDAGTWGCVDAGGAAVPVTAAVVTLTNGSDVTCTIGNIAQPSALTLRKVVTNDNGGTAVDTDWTLTATGPTTGLSGVTGQPQITAATVAIGTYELSESGPGGYTAGDWTCTDGGTPLPVTEGFLVEIGLGQEVTCTITNDDQPGTLTLTKEVDNADGGTAEATDWTLAADGPTAGIEGPTGSGPVTGVEVAAGDYTLSESGPAGYTASAWTCEGGTQSGDVVTIAGGDEVTCSITNIFEAPILTLAKQVINDAGGTAESGDWTLAADGPTSISGTTGSAAVTGVAVPPGSYTLSEEGPDGYTTVGWACENAGEPLALDGLVVELAAGDEVTCTAINADIPLASAWTVVKSSDPPTGSQVEPGQFVTYTLTASIVTGEDAADVVITDDLADVLDQASLVDGSLQASTGTASLAGTELTWDVGTLTGTQTLSYQVQVNATADGGRLRNLVVASQALPCPPGQACRETTHPILAAVAPALSTTGGIAWWSLLAAVALLATGGLMAWGAWRRAGPR